MKVTIISLKQISNVLMPTNTFGPNDNYDINNSHFLPALLRKVILAKRLKKKSITLWGTGKCKREVIHVDDVASAVIFFFKKKKFPKLI